MMCCWEFLVEEQEYKILLKKLYRWRLGEIIIKLLNCIIRLEREKERERVNDQVFIIYLVRYMYNLLVKIGCFFNYCRFCFVMIGMKIRLLLKQICGMNLEWRYFRIKFLYVFKILFVNCYMFIVYEFVIIFFFFYFFQCFDNFFQWKELEGVVMFGISSNFISQVWKDIYYQVSVRLG